MKDFKDNKDGKDGVVRTKVLTTRELYAKTFSTLRLDGLWADVLGEPESHGIWLIWGKDKNGKTQTALQLSDALSGHGKVLYVSAEEGMGKAFVESCERAGISAKNRNLRFLEYTPMMDIHERLTKRRSEDVIVIDNVTVYNDELKYGVVRELARIFQKKLFIYLAHEERNEPYTSTAKLIRKLAKVIMYVEGLQCQVGGRVPGGTIDINEMKAKIYHGETKN